MWELGYHAHGGSGMSWSRADVLAMEIGEIVRAYEWLGERRQAEADAIRNASGR
jgi:hypothetical protein